MSLGKNVSWYDFVPVLKSFCGDVNQYTMITITYFFKLKMHSFYDTGIKLPQLFHRETLAYIYR